MALNSRRKVKISCSDKDFFNYVTDIRNFGRFVPDSMRDGWTAENDSCRFSIPGTGEIKLVISKKEPFTLVKYSGNALSRIDFGLVLTIYNSVADFCEVELSLEATMDPLTMLIAAPNIEKFLDILANEMEKFTGWKE